MTSATGGRMWLPAILTGNSTCIWDTMFTTEEKTEMYLIQYSLDLQSSVAVLALLYMRNKLSMSKHIFEMTYSHLTIFLVAMFLRSTVPVALEEFCIKYCEATGFATTFLYVFEVEALTHLCIERYVVTKYVVKGWNLEKQHYTLYLFLSLFFALMYSSPVSYMDLGAYSQDFTCDTCSFNMILPKTWKKYFIVTTFVLRSVKPAAVMIIMMYWTQSLIKQPGFTRKMQRLSNVNFTKVVYNLLAVNLFFWAPMYILRGWIILSQLMYNQIWTPSYFATVLRWAMAMYQASPAVSAFLIYKMDRDIDFKQYKPTEAYRISEIMADNTVEPESDPEHRE